MSSVHPTLRASRPVHLGQCQIVRPVRRQRAARPDDVQAGYLPPQATDLHPAKIRGLKIDAEVLKLGNSIGVDRISGNADVDKVRCFGLPHDRYLQILTLHPEAFCDPRSCHLQVCIRRTGGNAPAWCRTRALALINHFNPFWAPVRRVGAGGPAGCLDAPVGPLGILADRGADSEDLNSKNDVALREACGVRVSWGYLKQSIDRRPFPCRKRIASKEIRSSSATLPTSCGRAASPTMSCICEPAHRSACAAIGSRDRIHHQRARFVPCSARSSRGLDDRTNTQRGVWYGSQGPQRFVIGRTLAELSSRLTHFLSVGHPVSPAPNRVPSGIAMRGRAIHPSGCAGRPLQFSSSRSV